MIKLIALDLDGTTLDPDRKLTSAVKNAIRQAKAVGVKIVITTGRPLMGVQDILEELNLREAGDFVITYNGALVQRADTQEEFIRQSLPAPDYLDIEHAARMVGLHSHAITRDGIYTTNRDIGKYTVQEAAMVHMPLYYRTAEEIARLDIAKVMMVDEPDLMDNAIAYLPFNFFEKYNLVKSTPYYLELMHKKASKGKAVLHLARKLHLAPEELMAIGDEENDRSMLEVVGHPVVMANGQADLQKIAKHITKSNANSGVAHAIHTWVLPDYQN